MVEPNAALTRILLVDDHAVVRTGMRMVIESRPGLEVVAEASDRVEALAAAAREQPDIILLDLDLGDDSGLDLLPELRAVAKDARILLLTGLRDTETHRRAVRMGAMGLVLKEKAVEVVIKAIEKVHAGEVWLDRAMIATVLQELSQLGDQQEPNPEASKIASLTLREREVIALVGQGLKNKQIAERLCISESTTRHHLTSIFAKLNVSDRSELVIYAYQHGLANLPGT